MSFMRVLFQRIENFPTCRKGFSVLELLVAAAVFSLLLVLLVSATSHINNAWQQSEAQKIRRQNARAIFTTLSRDLQSAAPRLPGQSANPVPFQQLAGFGDPASQGLFWGLSLPGNRSGSDLSTVGYFVGADHSLYRCYTNAAESDVMLLTNNTGGTNHIGLLAGNVLRFVTSTVEADGGTNGASAVYTTNLPRAVDVTLVLTDSRTLKRHPDLAVTNLESPPAGVQVFRARIDIPASR